MQSTIGITENTDLGFYVHIERGGNKSGISPLFDSYEEAFEYLQSLIDAALEFEFDNLQ